MMVPRALTIQRRESKGEVKISEKNMGIGSVLEIARPRSAPVVVTQRKVQEESSTRGDGRDERSRPTTPTRTITEPVCVPSSPVIIPPRSPSLTAAPTFRRSSKQGGRRPSSAFDKSHNPRAIPPSVAALLSVTSIPPPNPNASQRRRTSGTKAFHKTSIDDLLQEWREDDYGSSSNSLGAGSPLDVLLERADDSDVEDSTGRSPSSVGSSAHESGDGMSSRSISSDSIPSMPDLVLEDRSPSSWSSPTTPSVKFRRPVSGAEPRSWKDKVVSSLPAEECPLDHPLLPPLPLEESIIIEPRSSTSSLASTPRAQASQPTAPRSSFKSNLTASLFALTSSFRSFSNFTAPSIPPDDLLTRSLFNPTLPERYRPEMRPKSSDGVPDPVLRRYLNPTPRPERVRQAHQRRFSLEEQHISALSLYPEPDFAAAVNASSSLNAAVEREGPMIQMQTYGPARASKTGSGRKGKKLPPSPPQTGNLANTEAGRIAKAANRGELRQREPRENSDFLRVIVLEMNMRREGKLDARGAGRARVWLPPRKGGAVEREEEEEERGASRKVPVRWMSVAVDEA